MNVLTSREREILTLILHEFSTHEISAQLEISTRTVETHRKNILRKSGAKNLVGLVKYGLSLNLLQEKVAS